MNRKRERRAGSSRRAEWKCVESRIESERLHYGRFILSPLQKGQADIIGITMRKTLLGEIKGTSITCAKFPDLKVSHPYARIVGMEETVDEILLNLKEIVFRSFSNRMRKGSIRVSGPGCITAQDISVSSPLVQIVDTTQYIATLTEPIDLAIELEIERDRGYRMKDKENSQDGSYLIDAVFMPVKTVNYTIHNYKNENDEEILFLEIWTNGSLTPREALREASMNIFQLFSTFLNPEERDFIEEDEDTNPILAYCNLIFQDKASELRFWTKDKEFREIAEEKIKELVELTKHIEKVEFVENIIFIDQLPFSSRTYNCLKRSNINTLSDIFKNPDDLFPILDSNPEEFFDFLIVLLNFLLSFFKMVDLRRTR